MLKKNLFKKVMSAVLTMCFLFGSVRVACLASYPDQKNQKNFGVNPSKRSAKRKRTNKLKKGEAGPGCAKISSPLENYKDKNLINLTPGNDSHSMEKFHKNDEDDWEKEWTRMTQGISGRCDDHSIDNEQENNNLDNNSANAEENGNQESNETPQSTVSGYSASWHEIVFGDDNNE